MSSAATSLIKTGIQNDFTLLTQVAPLGFLTASIAHEVNQPLSGIITNVSTCLRMLSCDPPNLAGAREAARRAIRDGNRASEVITKLRSLFGKKPAIVESIDLNETAREAAGLVLNELQENHVVLHLELAEELPRALGDRVQLQQVILNLFRNASDAMDAVHDRPRQLVVRTERDKDSFVRLSVKDVGTGFDPQSAGGLFEAFYTTKHDGMGIGLSICRSIIARHRGRLWANLNDGPGATFYFTVPCAVQSEEDDLNNLPEIQEAAAPSAA
jgi:C4-dicarboxylate-specific signal transduction histidine kinase